MQLLGEVVGNTHFLDGTKLSLQEVGVPLFVLNQRAQIVQFGGGETAAWQMI